jgi:hypothetical protein
MKGGIHTNEPLPTVETDSFAMISIQSFNFIGSGIIKLIEGILRHADSMEIA